MSSFHFYLAVLAFAGGIALRTFYPLGLTTALVLAAAAFAAAAIWWAARHPIFLASSLGLFFLALGLLRMDFAAAQFGSSPLEAEVGRTLTLHGAVARKPDVRETFTHLYVRTEHGLILVSVSRHTDVRYGDVVSATGRLERPESFETDLGRIFNYPGYLNARGVEYRLAFATVSIEARDRGHPFIAALLNFKHSFTSALALVLPEPQYGLGVGMLLGMRQALGEELETAFRETGIIHIVVLSGYNVMLVVAFVSFLLAAFLPLWPRTIVGLFAIASFALMVGLSATVVRASIMASLFLLAYALGRVYEALRGLFLAGAVMLAVNPHLLAFDIGFQLSFMATLGLILALPHFESRLVRVPARIGLREFGLATLVTQLAVLPLLLYHVGEISVVSVVVNMLVLPLVPLAMFFTFALGLLSMLAPTAAMPLLYPAYASLQYIIVVAEWFASLPFAAVTVPEFGFLWVIAMYVALGGAFFWWSKRRRIARANHVARSAPPASAAGWVIEEEENRTRSTQG
jgi:competence protein ComEC